MAWLQSGLRPSEVEASTRLWLTTWKVSLHASFIYRAWLGANGDVDVVAQPIKDWLSHGSNRLLPHARFIYSAWLDAKGELDVVTEPIKEWLSHEKNRLLPDANFI